MPKNKISKKRYFANGVLTIREKVCCEECRSRRANLVKVFRFCASGKTKFRHEVRVKFGFTITALFAVLDELTEMRLITVDGNGGILIKGKDA